MCGLRIKKPDPRGRQKGKMKTKKFFLFAVHYIAMHHERCGTSGFLFFLMGFSVISKDSLLKNSGVKIIFQEAVVVYLQL
jgi:hypothetical protein